MGNYYEEFPPPFFLTFKPRHRPLSTNSAGYGRSDIAIVADVRAQLAMVSGIDVSDVAVSCDHQIVRLKGEAASAAVVRYIGQLADNTLGVRAVANELTVRRAGASAADFTSRLPEGYPTPSSLHEMETPSSDKTPNS